MHTRIKICCISAAEEVTLAVKAGVHALGLVSHMPSGPGVITDQLAAKLARQAPPGIATFLLTSLLEGQAIIAQLKAIGANTVQLVDAVTIDTYAQIREALPNVRIVQVLHVLDESDIELALAVAPYVDALLLDSGNPNLAVKELGGTGRIHNWDISRRIVKAVNIPVWLAGGLNPDNIAEAIRQVQPFGVDICSGVRSHGQLDPEKLERFVRMVASA